MPGSEKRPPHHASSRLNGAATPPRRWQAGQGSGTGWSVNAPSCFRERRAAPRTTDTPGLPNGHLAPQVPTPLGSVPRYPGGCVPREVTELRSSLVCITGLGSRGDLHFLAKQSKHSGQAGGPEMDQNSQKMEIVKSGPQPLGGPKRTFLAWAGLFPAVLARKPPRVSATSTAQMAQNGPKSPKTVPVIPGSGG